ncbi:MAG: hypothetical protein ACP5I8_15975 [Phycisphaerae bacterium]
MSDTEDRLGGAKLTGISAPKPFARRLLPRLITEQEHPVLAR